MQSYSLFILFLFLSFSVQERSFKIEESEFLKDGKPFRIISGSFHYFRVVPQYWSESLKKMKSCGLNTVETYIPWNLHQPTPDRFDFGGILNISKFIETAAENNLLVIVRPSPYVGANLDFGGMPSWLLADKAVRIRCSNQKFLSSFKKFLDTLLPKLLPFQYESGGPIIAMQIENEYGSYGGDHEYLKQIRKMFIDHSVKTILFSSNVGEDFAMLGGNIDDVLKTINFGISDPDQQLDILSQHQTNSPRFCSEFRFGSFDRWGGGHTTYSATLAAEILTRILELGASVNMYMFHGGTNFGFMNGANYLGSSYEPVVTSYGYDSPINESGDLTEMCNLFKKVIQKYAPVDEELIPVPTPKRDYGTFQFSHFIPLFYEKTLSHLSPNPIQSVTPLTMEEVKQDYGFILYRTYLRGPLYNQVLKIQDVRDRALVFFNQTYIGVIDRFKTSQELIINIPKEGGKLDILVENMGRISHGTHLATDFKGITEGVLINSQFIFNWTIYCLPMKDLSKLQYSALKNGSSVKGPVFMKATFDLTDPNEDTFVSLTGGTKGFVVVNNFNLGRYWNIGPQQNLYLPAPLLKKGKNEIIVFELHKFNQSHISLVSNSDLGHANESEEEIPAFPLFSGTQEKDEETTEMKVTSEMQPIDSSSKPKPTYRPMEPGKKPIDTSKKQLDAFTDDEESSGFTFQLFVLVIGIGLGLYYWWRRSARQPIVQRGHRDLGTEL